jgi:hypothetical protein
MSEQVSIASTDEALSRIAELVGHSKQPDLARPLLLQQVGLLALRARLTLDEGRFPEAAENAEAALSLQRAVVGDDSAIRDTSSALGVASALITLGWLQLLPPIASPIGALNYAHRAMQVFHARSDAVNSSLTSEILPELQALGAELESKRLHSLRNQALDALDEEERRKTLLAEEQTRHEQDEWFRQWGVPSSQLDRLVKEIAERIARAGALLARTPHPDAFIRWLSSRLSTETRLATDHTQTNTERLDEPSVSVARKNAAHALEEIWASDEFYPAEELLRRLGAVTAEQLHEYTIQGTVLGVPNPAAANSYAYPRWQFEAKNHRAVVGALRHFVGLPPWANGTSSIVVPRFFRSALH